MSVVEFPVIFLNGSLDILLLYSLKHSELPFNILAQKRSISQIHPKQVLNAVKHLFAVLNLSQCHSSESKTS